MERRVAGVSCQVKMRKVVPLSLEAEHRRILNTIVATKTVPDEVRKRAYILLYKADGFSDNDIATMLALSRITVRRWITRYESRDPEDKITQLLDVSKGRGRRENLTDREKDWIFSLIETTPHGGKNKEWDIKSIRKRIACNAEKAGYNRLKEIGYRDVYKMVVLYRHRPWAHVKY